jgi:hypothetical protein
MTEEMCRGAGGEVGQGRDDPLGGELENPITDAYKSSKFIFVY